ncbi:hypothetical protein AB0D38_25665, partial [Streptomyces sp. NPDC048279]|uniref:hypothetical protein n=1 Tax=Streptomyces sp. NPDC048279 TaxID=3154714 RepID=UPI003441E956
GVMTVVPDLKDTSPEKLLAPVLSAFWDEDRSWTLDVYRRHDGYVGGVDAPRNLRVGHERRRLGGHVGGEGVRALLPVREQEAVPGRQDGRQDGRHRGVGRRGRDGWVCSPTPWPGANAATCTSAATLR